MKKMKLIKNLMLGTVLLSSLCGVNNKSISLNVETNNVVKTKLKSDARIVGEQVPLEWNGISFIDSKYYIKTKSKIDKTFTSVTGTYYHLFDVENAYYDKGIFLIDLEAIARDSDIQGLKVYRPDSLFNFENESVEVDGSFKVTYTVSDSFSVVKSTETFPFFIAKEDFSTYFGAGEKYALVYSHGDDFKDVVYSTHKQSASQSKTVEINLLGSQRKSLEDVLYDGKRNYSYIENLFGFSINNFQVKESNYVVGKGGDYVVKASFNDTLSYPATHYLTYNIHVEDDIINDNTFTLNLNKADNVSLDSIKTLFNAKDIFGKEVSIELSDNGGYDGSVAGTYTLIYTATDDNNNTATLTVTCKVVDYSPIIRLKNVETNHFLVNYSQNVSSSYILENFIEVVDYEGNVIENPSITWDKAFNAKQIGTTTYRLSCASSIVTNAIGEMEIEVEIKQDIPPVFFVVSNIAFTSQEKPLNYEQVKNLIAFIDGVDVNSMAKFNIQNYDDYYSNFKEKSTLNYSYTINGVETNKTLMLNPINEVVKDSNKWDILWSTYISKCNKWYDYISYFFTYLIPEFFKTIGK